MAELSGWRPSPDVTKTEWLHPLARQLCGLGRTAFRFHMDTLFDADTHRTHRDAGLARGWASSGDA